MQKSVGAFSVVGLEFIIFRPLYHKELRVAERNGDKDSIGYWTKSPPDGSKRWASIESSSCHKAQNGTIEWLRPPVTIVNVLL